MHNDPSFEKFLCACMIPPKESQELPQESSTKESSVEDSKEESTTIKCESCEYSCLQKDSLEQHIVSVHEGKMPFKCQSCEYSCILSDSLEQHIASVHEDSTAGSSNSKSATIKSKTNKICKSTWKGTKCQVKICSNIHIAPCQDRECQALDGGLPLYKTRNCQLWQVRPKVKSNSKKSKYSHRASSDQNYQPHDKKLHLQQNKKRHQVNRRNSDRPVKNLGQNNFQYVIKNGKQQQTSFRVPDSQYFQNHPQAPSYSSVVKGQINSKASSPVLGNEPALLHLNP